MEKGFGKYAHVTISEKFGEWPAKISNTYYTSTIGTWFIVYYTGPSDLSYRGHWMLNGQLTPKDFGYYSCNDQDYLNTTFTYLKNIGFDFLILGDTNGHWKDDGLIARNIDTIFSVASKLDDKSPAIAIATGMPVVDAGIEAQQEEVDYFYTHYVQQYPNTYFSWKGKPFLLVYNVPFKPWTDIYNRFSIRYGPGLVSWGKGMLPEPSQGYWGWVFDEQYPNSEVMGVQPGYNRSHFDERSRKWILPRNKGDRYIRTWLDAVKRNPEAIVLASWNDHIEQTSVEAANWPEGEDSYFYEKITEAYLALKYGCIDGFYYREENSNTVYQYSAKQRHLYPIIKEALPGKLCEPVILVPDGYFKWLEHCI